MNKVRLSMSGNPGAFKKDPTVDMARYKVSQVSVLSNEDSQLLKTRLVDTAPKPLVTFVLI